MAERKVYKAGISDSDIIQIKIRLLDTDPEIFRRVLVYENTSLDLTSSV